MVSSICSEAACTDWIAYQTVELNWTGWVYDHVETRNENQISCFAKHPPEGTVAWYSIIAIMRSCDGKGWVNNAMTCARNVCPANSTGTPESNPTSCTCDKGYVPDSAGTSCVPAATCPVTPLSNPPFTDACSTSLEEGKGVDVNNKCGELTKNMQDAAACIKKKIEALSSPSITYNGPSATIRTAEYQNHLWEIWDKSSQLNTIMNSVVYTPETKLACGQRKVEVDNAKLQHTLKYQPSSAEEAAPHVERRAIDVSLGIIESMATQVNVYTTTIKNVNGKNVPVKVLISDIEDYINSKTINPSPECASIPYIKWGGNFKRIDSVHFQLQN